MPPVLKAKMFGLPRWAWIAILAGGITVGLILRHRAQKKAIDSADPCDPQSTAYDPAQCQQNPTTFQGAGNLPDSGDPCDPASASYDPEICSGNGGLFLGSGGGGVYTGAPTAPAPTTTININPPTLPSPTDPAAQPTPSGCSEVPGGAPPNFHFECVSNRWTLVANPHSGGHTNPTPHTGGGPPNKPDNKGNGVHIGVGQAHPVRDPVTPTGQEHPQAVDTGNPCVRGGVGKHTAPAGYHLFCGSNGRIWRAPNS